MIRPPPHCLLVQPGSLLIGPVAQFGPARGRRGFEHPLLVQRAQLIADLRAEYPASG